MAREDLVEYLTKLLWSGLAGAGLAAARVEGAAPGAERPRIAAVPPIADHSG